MIANILYQKEISRRMQSIYPLHSSVVSVQATLVAATAGCTVPAACSLLGEWSIYWAYAMLHLPIHPLTGSRAFLGVCEALKGGVKASHFDPLLVQKLKLPVQKLKLTGQKLKLPG